MENKTVYTYGSGDMGTYECADMGTYECVKVKESPLEIVNAARSAAHNAEVKSAKMSVYVAQMQGSANYYLNELKICKEDKRAEAEENVANHNNALAEAHAEWSALLSSAEELWQKYSDLLEDYEEKERNAERPDEKCTFCGEMGCDGDHGDEMRDIGRMEDKYWRRC